MNDETRDERLQRILREADSAEGETGLTTEEVRDMRRTVLTAMPEPRRRPVLSPVLAGAAIVAAIVALMMWPRSESTTSPPPAAPRVAMKPRPEMRPDMNARATAGVPSGTSPVLVPSGTTVGSPAASAPGEEEPDRLADAGGIAQSIEEQPRSRQIQFDTPGGTRVIWILTSGNAL